MTSGVTDTPTSGGPPADGELAWHTLGADQVLRSEGVDGQRGLSSAEAAARAERFGPNVFAAGRAEPRWRAFLPHYGAVQTPGSGFILQQLSKMQHFEDARGDFLAARLSSLYPDRPE